MKKINSGRFTLIELIIVCAVIGILVTLLLPSLAKSRAIAKSAVCQSNLSQIARGSFLYSSMNSGKLAPVYQNGYKITYSHWNYYISGLNHGLFYEMLKSFEVYYCPGLPKDNDDKTVTNFNVYIKKLGGIPSAAKLNSLQVGNNRVRASYYFNIEEKGDQKIYRWQSELDSNSLLVTDMLNSQEIGNFKGIFHPELSIYNVAKGDGSAISVVSKSYHNYIKNSIIDRTELEFELAVQKLKNLATR